MKKEATMPTGNISRNKYFHKIFMMSLLKELHNSI